MSEEEKFDKKCFTFIWKLENASYCWQPIGDFIESPSFIIDELEDTKWTLILRVRNETAGKAIGLFLKRDVDKSMGGKSEISCDLAFMSSDGKVLRSTGDIERRGIRRFYGTSNLLSRNEVFSTRRSVFLPEDVLTTRCRIWKKFGEISNEIQCFARSRINVEKRSLLWNIENFSAIESDETETFEIGSIETGDQLMELELSIKGGQILEETIQLEIIPDYENIQISTLKLYIVDASKNAEKCFEDEFWVHDSYESKEFTLPYSKRELMEKKSIFLPNDVLSLWCDCTFSTDVVLDEIEEVIYNNPPVKRQETDHLNFHKGNELPTTKCMLIDDFKSMLNNTMLSDVKLKTRSKTYPAHKCILGFRSPVFQAMFTNDMKENINDCVDIDDLSDETVFHMLKYIYSAEVEELDWNRAMELFVAADKYQILHLRDICLNYLKRNLCADNACQVLVLSDLHQDKILKDFVQDFILKQGKSIINSEEWDQLMETNAKLAAETMRLKYRE